MTRCSALVGRDCGVGSNITLLPNHLPPRLRHHHILQVEVPHWCPPRIFNLKNQNVNRAFTDLSPSHFLASPGPYTNTISGM